MRRTMFGRAMLLFVVAGTFFTHAYPTTSATPALTALSDTEAGRGIEFIFDPRTYDYHNTVGVSRFRGLSQLTELPRVLHREGETLAGVRSGGGEGPAIIVDRAVGAAVRDCDLGQSIRVYDHNSGTASVVVEHCTLDGNPNAISGLAISARYNDITSDNDGITPTGGATGMPTLIEYNRIFRDGSRVGENHHDGIQFWQGGNAVIRRNWISGWHTSAILIKSDLELRPGDGPVSNICIEENYLANPSGYYTIYVRDGGFGRPRFITIRNNAFGPGIPISSGPDPDSQAVFVRTGAERDEAVAAGYDEAAEWIVWDNNYDAVTGKEVVPPGGWRIPASPSAVDQNG